MSLLNLTDLTNKQIEDEVEALIYELEKRADRREITSYEIDTHRHYIQWSASSMSC